MNGDQTMMHKSWRVKRNIRKHIRKYDAADSNAAKTARSVLGVALAAVFALTVPISAIFFAANLVFRLPDLYNFDISRTVVAEDIELKTKTDAIGDLISDYMFHRTDYFQLRAEYQGREKPVFSINDGMNIGRYRTLLDHTII
ncbi:MAG: hypothetical protein LBO81_02845, partial [Clostridiales Family XIII bacterium]|nr:hypothetical protein [Clostridiales Family XIII bacterium]